MSRAVAMQSGVVGVDAFSRVGTAATGCPAFQNNCHSVKRSRTILKTNRPAKSRDLLFLWLQRAISASRLKWRFQPPEFAIPLTPLRPVVSKRGTSEDRLNAVLERNCHSRSRT